MQLPDENANTVFEELLQDLPAEIETMAREFKAFTRSRKIETPRELLRVVLLYCGQDQSLRQVAGQMTLLNGQGISDTAIKQRLVACQAWVKAVVPKMVRGLPVGALGEGQRLLVTDATDVVAPGAQGSQYRLHVTLDMIRLEFVDIQITDKHTAESLNHVPVANGDIVVADRFYARRHDIIGVHNRGADVIVRHHWRQVPVYNPQGDKIDLIPLLSRQPEKSVQTVQGIIRSDSGQALPVFLHCYRLSDQDAAEARRRVRRNRRKSKNGPKPETVFFAGFVIVLTTIEPQQMSAQTVLDVYRCRWQVELAIKRWKSLLDVAQLRAKEGSQLAHVWLAGKMIYALLIERRARRLMPKDFDRLDTRRTRTWWRVWKAIRQEVAEKLMGCRFWIIDAWPECVRVMSERTRHRPLQTVPQQAIQYLRAMAGLVDQIKKAA